MEYGKPVDHDDVELGSAPEWDPGASDSAAIRWDTGMGAGNRADFIRKVYGILTVQMLITVAICAFAMLVPPVQALFVHLVRSPIATIMLFIPALGVLCALHAYKGKHPTNLYLLMAFTVLMSISVAGTCAAYQKAGLGVLVLQAFGLTAAAFGGLSAYALKSGQDFTWMGGMLHMGLLAMMMFSFFGWIFGFSGGMFFSLIGALLFCGYILYDTSRILKEYGPDDAVIACVDLYLDILNLFLYLLELLSQCQGSE